jgi:hypothetical protein
MEAYQERVVQEKKELDEKIEKLNDFVYGSTEIYPNLKFEERVRLKMQLGYMKEYSKILGERIADFK